MILTKFIGMQKIQVKTKNELIQKREDVGIKYCNDPNVFIECSNTMDDVYENIDDRNPSKNEKF